MSKNCPIMQRMKANYEVRSRTYLTRKVPVIMRLDGKAFHTYTRGLEKPFDEGLIEDMVETAKFLCSEIQGAKCAYVQSDEISILITDFDKLETSAWFDYQVQKMCSVAAAMAAAKFNQLRFIRLCNTVEIPEDQPITHLDLYEKLAFFDARVFNIPKEEVPNYFHARQRDAVKNSISMLAQSLYSHKELEGKNGSEMQEMCFQKGHNWNDLHYSKKRGSFIVKNTYVNNIGTHDLDKKGNKILQYFNDTKAWAVFDEAEQDWLDLVSPIIRTKWECIETPMKLNDENIFVNF